jgi:hypothetical protein
MTQWDPEEAAANPDGWREALEQNPGLQAALQHAWLTGNTLAFRFSAPGDDDGDPDPHGTRLVVALQEFYAEDPDECRNALNHYIKQLWPGSGIIQKPK